MKTSKHTILTTILLLVGLCLLATLVIFEINDRQEIKTQKEKSLLALKIELENNHQILGIWKEWDDEVSIKLDTLIARTGNDENFEGRLPMKLYLSKPREISTNQSIHSFKDGAWRALLDSGLAKHLDFDTLETLEKLYGSQKVLVNVFQGLPPIQFNSKLDKKFTRKDSDQLYAIRMTFSNLMLAEERLNEYFKEVFELPEFEGEGKD